MRRLRVGLMLFLASFTMNEARGQTETPMPGSPPGKPMPGGVIGPTFRPMCGAMTGSLSGSFGGCMGTMSGMPHGMIGMTGCCGGVMGQPFGGCCGPFIGGCGGGFSGQFCGNFNGFPGCCGGMIQPNLQQNVHQFYTAWTKTPGRSYYHRSLFVYFPPLVDKHHELLLIHYPDRRGELFLYDPSQRQYIAKYHVGAKTEALLQMVPTKDRRALLKDIPNSAYGKPGSMPTLQQLGIVPPGVPENSIIRATQLRRPPSALPDEDVSLPPDESLEKK